MPHHTHPHLPDMRIALELLATELNTIGWWQSPAEKPSAQALSSIEPFCVDTLTFSQWLQWVYIPKMHAYMNQTGQLPQASGLLPIAEEAWKNTPENTSTLFEIIHLLDAIIIGEHQALLRRLLSLQ